MSRLLFNQQRLFLLILDIYLSIIQILHIEKFGGIQTNFLNFAKLLLGDGNMMLNVACH